MPGYPPQAMGYQPVGGGAWIFFGYIFALLGGLLGIGIGGMLLQSTVKDPYGNKVKKYTGASRTHGIIILVLGSVMFAIATQMGG